MPVTKSQNTKEIYRAAVYARVSTLQEEQEDSFENQKEYYSTLINLQNNLILTEVYGDRYSGTSDKREGFLNMLRDAKQGKFDLIIVKSISRFARNIIDCQKYLHYLKSLNITVYFDQEKISSKDQRLEFVMGVLSLCAEQESRSISDNIKWSYRRKEKEGIRHLGNNRILGYDEINGILCPNEKSYIVKMIYDLYLEHKSLVKVQNILHKRSIPTLRNKETFGTKTIWNILTNPIYTGDRILQKKAPKDFYTRKPSLDKWQSYLIKNDHEPIIDRYTFEEVQNLLYRNTLG